MSTSLSSYLGRTNLPDISQADMAKSIQDSLADDPGGAPGKYTYLTFSGKTGKYSLGQSKDDIDVDRLYYLEPASLQEGWICWKGGKPCARHDWSIYHRAEKAVPESALEDHSPYNRKKNEGWRPSRSFALLDIEHHSESSKPVIFSTSTVSALNAVKDLLDKIAERAAAGEPSYPIITMDREEFIAQEEKNFKPQFTVEAWIVREAMAAYVDGQLTIDQLMSGEFKAKKTRGRGKK
mgnify:CR=1 FL=1|jgi:hypothetical protein